MLRLRMGDPSKVVVQVLVYILVDAPGIGITDRCMLMAHVDVEHVDAARGAGVGAAGRASAPASASATTATQPPGLGSASEAIRDSIPEAARRD
jgi:hypothetical protein